MGDNDFNVLLCFCVRHILFRRRFLAKYLINVLPSYFIIFMHSWAVDTIMDYYGLLSIIMDYYVDEVICCRVV